MVLVFSYSEDQYFVLGRLSPGESFTYPLFGNVHSKKVSTKELPLEESFENKNAIFTFLTQPLDKAMVVKHIIENNTGKDVTLYWPERNRKYIGVITNFDYETTRCNNYNLTIDMIITRTLKIKESIE